MYPPAFPTIPSILGPSRNSTAVLSVLFPQLADLLDHVLGPKHGSVSDPNQGLDFGVSDTQGIELISSDFDPLQ